jgi:DNA-binding transcriptional LysR family regulator
MSSYHSGILFSNMASLPTEMSIFQRVIERGSFAGAAEDVGLSPSAVAKLITRLERRLGVRLINRTTRRLALTAEGEIYLERSRDILEAIEAAESEIASARVSPHGHLRVHAFPSFAVDKLAPILPEFLARYPRITIDFLLTNRFVDVIGENVDVAFSGGAAQRLHFDRTQDCRSHKNRLCQPGLSCLPWSADPTFRSCAAFMSNNEPHSGRVNLAVPN